MVITGFIGSLELTGENQSVIVSSRFDLGWKMGNCPVVGFLAIMLSTGIIATSVEAAPKKNSAVTASSKAKAAKDQAIELATIAELQGESISSCDDVKRQVKDMVPADTVSLYAGKWLKPHIWDTGITKGEYETTKEFEKRRDLILFAYFGEPKRVVFYGEIDSDAQTYDADEEMLSVNMPKGQYPEYLLNTIGSEIILMGWNVENHGMKRGKTKLGVSFQYKSFSIFESYLVLKNTENSNLKDEIVSSYSGKFKFGINRKNALNLRDNLKFVILGEIEEPYKLMQANEEVASLDNPVNTEIYTYAYYVNPKCGYIFDKSTGEIMSTIFESPLVELRK